VTGGGERLRSTSAEFRAYAEQVFRTHNDVTTSMAYAIDDLEGAADADRRREGLIDADDRMMRACSGLNEIASARRDNRTVSLKKRAAAAKRVPDCELASRDAADLIGR
jgi:hypothetical protein